MPRIDLAYGRHGLSVEVSPTADIIEPRYLPGLFDEAGAIRRAIREPTSGPPLSQLVPRGASVGISVCDVTRPFPGQRVLPVLVDELQNRGAGPITIFVATGTHRLCTPAELDQMVDGTPPQGWRIRLPGAPVEVIVDGVVATLPAQSRLQLPSGAHAIRVRYAAVTPV